jgi:hypothetical protein
MPSSFQISANNAVYQLATVKKKLSRLPPLGSADDPFYMHLHGVVITAPILRMLVEILNHPLPKDSSATATTERRWDHVSILDNCTVARVDTNSAYLEEDYCSEEDLRLLASTLACRVVSLSLQEAPQILECLSYAPQLEHDDFSINQMAFSALDCSRLGQLVQRSVMLKNLMIIGPSNLEEPQTLGDCLANSVHLQVLKFMRLFRPDSFQEVGQPFLDTIIRPDGNDVVVRLLRNPQSQLKTLHIAGLHMKDRHFKAIVEALPFSKVEELGVQGNDIQSHGIFAFAKELPKITCLREVYLCSNPWEKSGLSFKKCGAALLRGMLTNYSILSLTVYKWCPQLQLAAYYFCLNWAGRRLLATSSTVPLGLWPLVLERAVKSNNSLDDDDSTLDRRPDAIYMFLQKSPILSHIHSSYSMRNRPRKKPRAVDLQL